MSDNLVHTMLAGLTLNVSTQTEDIQRGLLNLASNEDTLDSLIRLAKDSTKEVAYKTLITNPSDIKLSAYLQRDDLTTAELKILIEGNSDPLVLAAAASHPSADGDLLEAIADRLPTNAARAAISIISRPAASLEARIKALRIAEANLAENDRYDPISYALGEALTLGVWSKALLKYVENPETLYHLGDWSITTAAYKISGGYGHKFQKGHLKDWADLATERWPDKAAIRASTLVKEAGDPTLEIAKRIKALKAAASQGKKVYLEASNAAARAPHLELDDTLVALDYKHRIFSSERAASSATRYADPIASINKLIKLSYKHPQIDYKLAPTVTKALAGFPEALRMTEVPVIHALIRHDNQVNTYLLNILIEDIGTDTSGWNDWATLATTWPGTLKDSIRAAKRVNLI